MLKIVRMFFFPVIPIYWLITEVRNLLFDNGIYRSQHVNAKIISVGNLTVGGSGKTPLVIYIAHLLKVKNFRVGILSRGYGRKTKGYLLVSDGDEVKVNVGDGGDEIFQATIETNVAAAVCENRVEGSIKFIKDTGVEIIILDDGYQHRWIQRDLNILLFEQKFLTSPAICENIMLPTGNLRESLNNVNRADLIIINRKFYEKKAVPESYQKLFSGKKLFDAYYTVIGFIDVKTGKEYNAKSFEGQRGLVVVGVAAPESFFDILNKLNVNNEKRIVFRDHKDYNYANIQKVRKDFYSHNSSCVITTQKDAVKLMKFSNELDDIDIYYLKIAIEITNKEEFDTYIIKKVS